jgi:hypothetical protein
MDFASAQIYHALKIMPLSHPDTGATIAGGPFVGLPGFLRQTRGSVGLTGGLGFLGHASRGLASLVLGGEAG